MLNGILNEVKVENDELFANVAVNDEDKLDVGLEDVDILLDDVLVEEEVLLDVLVVVFV